RCGHRLLPGRASGELRPIRRGRSLAGTGAADRSGFRPSLAGTGAGGRRTERSRSAAPRARTRLATMFRRYLAPLPARGDALPSAGQVSRNGGGVLESGPVGATLAGDAAGAVLRRRGSASLEERRAVVPDVHVTGSARARRLADEPDRGPEHPSRSGP